jgi:hypothetical protein
MSLGRRFADPDFAHVDAVDVGPGESLTREDVQAVHEALRQVHPNLRRVDADAYFRDSEAEERALRPRFALGDPGRLDPEIRRLVERAQARIAPRFREQGPAVRDALRREFGRMLPTDVSVRLQSRISAHGLEAYETVEPPSPWSPWTLRVALDPGPATAKVKGFHGIAGHILRDYGLGGLYTLTEWRLLLDTARKAGIEQELRQEPIRMGGVTRSMWGAYVEAYARFGRTKQAEYLDQELVGRLAETWAQGTNYGAHVNTLLERIARFLEAVRNALRGLGFQTADDVFERVVSGEIARRAEGGRREPTFDSPSRGLPP